MGPFNNYVTPRGGVKRCVTDRSQHNVKKRYEGVRGGGGGKNISKKRYVIVEQPL